MDGTFDKFSVQKNNRKINPVVFLFLYILLILCVKKFWSYQKSTKVSSQILGIPHYFSYIRRVLYPDLTKIINSCVFKTYEKRAICP